MKTKSGLITEEQILSLSFRLGFRSEAGVQLKTRSELIFEHGVTVTCLESLYYWVKRQQVQEYN